MAASVPPPTHHAAPPGTPVAAPSESSWPSPLSEREMDQLRALLDQFQKMEERKRAEESAKHKAALEEQRKRDEEWKKQIHELVLKQHEEKLAAVRGRNKLIHALAALAGALAAGSGVYAMESKSVPDTVPVPVTEVSRADFRDIEYRVQRAEDQIEMLHELVRRQQELIVDSTAWLADKIDAVHPRQATKVRRPASLRRAAEEVRRNAEKALRAR